MSFFNAIQATQQGAVKSLHDRIYEVQSAFTAMKPEALNTGFLTLHGVYDDSHGVKW